MTKFPAALAPPPRDRDIRDEGEFGQASKAFIETPGGEQDS